MQKKVMFKTKVCTKVGNSLFLAFFMIRNWTLFSVKMVNLKNAEMKLYLSWLGFKSKERCLHELWDNEYKCNKQCYQMRANVSFQILNVLIKHLHFNFVWKILIKLKIKKIKEIIFCNGFFWIQLLWIQPSASCWR